MNKNNNIQKISHVTYNNKKYSIIHVIYKGHDIPVVCDYNRIESVGKYKLKCDDLCNISYNINGHKNRLYNLITKTPKNVCYSYINELGLDNRIENLERKNVDRRQICYNIPKNIKNLPPYVLYVKGDQSHGDRFMLKLKDYKWTTTSSKDITTSIKLDIMKQHMIKLRKLKPELFIDTELDKNVISKKKKLLNSFYKIIYKVGYKNIKKLKLDSNGNIISDKNKYIKKINRQNSLKYIPKKYRECIRELPKYTYYVPSYNFRGDFFVLENHPLQKECNKKIWRTTSSKKVSLIEKYNELIKYLEVLNDNINMA
jgi:UDP-2,3-diacylglucosamine pyrophosphatase LpxH